MKALCSQAATVTANNYKFNGGTELENSFDVSYYETYFRNYDAQVGRFTGVDVLAENYFSQSPYHFSYNDPISFSDPTGAYSYNNESMNRYGYDKRGGLVFEPGLNWGFSDDPFSAIGFRGFDDNEGSAGGGGPRGEGWGAHRFDAFWNGILEICNNLQSGYINLYNSTDGTKYGYDKNGDYGIWLNFSMAGSNDPENGLQEVIVGTKFVGLGENYNGSYDKKKKYKDLSDPVLYPGIKIYQNYNESDYNAVTLPGFGIYLGGGLTGRRLIRNIQHEYGHFLDYKNSPDLHQTFPVLMNGWVSFYLFVGLPSFINAGTGIGGTHATFWTEKRANIRAIMWFGKNIDPDFLKYFPIN